MVIVLITPADWCEWSEWSIWTACADPCSGGVRQRFRQPLASPPGSHCKSQETQSQSCNTGLCPGMTAAAFMRKLWNTYTHISQRKTKWTGYSRPEWKNGLVIVGHKNIKQSRKFTKIKLWIIKYIRVSELLFCQCHLSAMKKMFFKKKVIRV